ncbi:glycoside hydrolase family 36 protein [Planctomonas psychrotolerans]|uniref:glycoside hydrolase family 36 protein n=1 Tax=Planctomonas psychrotolerans TaxID=2528712 RepID=UPI00123C344A|nr:glycoside hydrolase family 36 protein [Planctomonas psychrotolerans]
MTAPDVLAPAPVVWGNAGVTLEFDVSGDAPVRLRSFRPADAPAADPAGPGARPTVTTDQPLVEVSAIGHGRFPGGFRHVDTVIGKRLRYASHSDSVEGTTRRLEIVQADPETGLEITSVFVTRGDVAAVQAWSEAVVRGDGELMLDFLSSFATGSYLGDSGSDVDDLDLVHGDNDWVVESRWRREPLRTLGLARIDRELQHHSPRSRCAVTNRGSWSTGEKLPTGVLVSNAAPFALCWQIEHNGPWGYELGETRASAYLLLHGPTDAEHSWSRRVSASRPFVSVPVSVGVVEGGIDEAFAVLTAQRRALRTVRDIDRTLPVVFNDYMNTLMGDPTTEKLLPLIDAAAETGADYFCIDAGWYAEGHWWDTVGAWEPAASRFPAGITEVIDHIRARGMVAGLWLEPEVIGIHSPLAQTLPDEAFFSRGGVRVAEHGRHLLDLRSPAAVRHLDEVVDRLVSDYGVGFFKMDYNTMTGPGTDSTGTAPGDGLLDHNRALLDWLDRIQARHPHLLIENCASGAMRMDYAMMSRLHLQSTSDQQDPVMYAPIAAAAPASLLPEQAGNWAYPQAGMSDELLTFSLVNAIAGRMYLSGYLNRMSADERRRVSDAVAAQKVVLADIERSTAVWPLGLPGWEDPWVAMGLAIPDGPVYLTVWRRPDADGGSHTLVLPFPALRGADVTVDPFFPADQTGWDWAWDAAEGRLMVTVAAAAPTARVLTLRRA